VVLVGGGGGVVAEVVGRACLATAAEYYTINKNIMSDRVISHGTALSKHPVAKWQWRPVIVDQLRSAVRFRATFFGRPHPHATKRVQLRMEMCF